jgi:cysteate synthase
MQTDYVLECLATGEELCDDDMPLANPNAAEPAFLRTKYGVRSFSPKSRDLGIYRFGDWLPLRRALEGSSAPVSFRSEGLGPKLGLSNLWITFSGYWPERGATMLTGTFKECEAYSVCARMPAGYPHTLVVASAGNTARAFARVCSDNKIPLAIVVPEENVEALWSVGPLDPCVTVIAAGGGADYYDAIHLSGELCSLDGFVPEGGAKNVARRDGMATTVLSAVEAMGRIPDWYFQAVGSGTGAIAAWEANLRLIADGSLGDEKMRLALSQNAPFQLLHDSWSTRSRRLVDLPEEEAKRAVASINAKVLANRRPPYSVRGGLFDALSDTDGVMYAVPNRAAELAGNLFQETEGVDPAPAAKVAVASLIESVEDGLVGKDDAVLLNVTGGGIERAKLDLDVRRIPVNVTVHPKDATAELLLELLQTS